MPALHSTPRRTSALLLLVAVTCMVAGFVAAARALPPGGGGRWALALLGAGAAVAASLAFVLERAQARRTAARSVELEHLSAELLRANRSKSEFLAAASHELRTPLNAIVGFTELLRDGTYGALAPRQAAAIGKVEDSATHLRRLVDQILDLARLAAGRMEVHREPVDVRDLLLSVATEMEPLVAERGLTLSLSVGPALPRLVTDPTQLRQVIVNLVGNAIKFTPTGSIQLRARQATAVGSPGPGAWVELQVADTGIGIASADQARVFDEFEQVHAGARGGSESRGVGLGLPISRRLARHLGGDLTLASASGEGSVFSLWLPIAPAP
ncbi:MAG: HAMP domain-containing histidine kinase [Gemmatimonadetes bacterium]|nr:HAMP domain-containing histidine kinase [Gemmatimonadota bacterium]